MVSTSHPQAETKVLENLYIGGRKIARDKDRLQQLGITYVINCTLVREQGGLHNYFSVSVCVCVCVCVMCYVYVYVLCVMYMYVFVLLYLVLCVLYVLCVYVYRLQVCSPLYGYQIPFFWLTSLMTLPSTASRT